MRAIFSNHFVVSCLIAIAMFLLTELVKKPIKDKTANIKDERKRKLYNKAILLIPFAFGMLATFLYDVLLLKSTFDFEMGLKYFSASLTIYTILEGVLIEKGSKEAKEVKELVDKVIEDGKVDAKDIQAVKDFIGNVANDTATDTEAAAKTYATPIAAVVTQPSTSTEEKESEASSNKAPTAPVATNTTIVNIGSIPTMSTEKNLKSAVDAFLEEVK